ncbi:transposase, partial [Fusarium beomiforme]
MLSSASTPTISTPPIKSNRDSLLCAVYGDLIPETTKQRQHMISWASMGYEIGLARGEDPDSFEREAFTEAAFQVEERELRLWRKRGAVGKLHNIVRFVRASPQRRELMKSLACDQNDEDGYQLFEEERAAIDLKLMQNNETRWNSTFLMIQRAIREREHIDHFIAYLETKTVSATKRSSTQRIEQGRGREKHLPQHAREEYTDVVLQDENLDDDHRRCVQISIKN